MLEAIFTTYAKEVSLFGLTQWDKGQKLRISFDNMPKSFQVHFSVRGSNEAIVVDAVTDNKSAVVDIPDEMLMYDTDISAWIYLIGDSSGETIGKVTLYVKPRPRPKGYIEDLVPSQQKIVEDMISQLKANFEHIIANGVDSKYVPEYIKNEAMRVAKKVLAVQNENTISFIAAGDSHYDNSDYYTKKSIEHAGQAMELIRSMCNIDFSAFLGDYIADGSDKNLSDAKNAILTVNKAIFGGFDGTTQFRCVGGDDLLLGSYNRNGDYLDVSELYPLIGKWSSDSTFNPEDEIGGYCYKDYEKQKLRVICLNTSDFKVGEKVSVQTNKAKMSAKQLLWLCDTLSFADKTDNEGWSSIIFSHYPINYFNAFGTAKEILNANAAKSKVDMLDGDGNKIVYDFSGNSSHPVVAMFNGELHNFKVNYINSILLPLISVPNICFGNNNTYAGEEYTSNENLLYGEDITWNKTAGTEKETAFCVITIDMKKGKLYAHCYGAGYDRTIDFEAVSVPNEVPEPGGNEDDNTGSGTTDSGTTGEGEYTNLVTTSIDDSENVFNQSGYKNDYYLTNQGDETPGDGFTCTGYIPCNSTDVIRIKGGTWSDLAGNNLVAYDEAFIQIWSTKLSGQASAASGMSYNGSVATFDTTNVTTGELEQMCYIRVSCKGNGKNLIVTANQNIPGSTTPPTVSDYVNIVSMSVEESGEEYNNGLGYKDNYALTEDASETEKSGFSITGYLEADKGSVLRFKGCGWSQSEGNYLMLYDDSFVLLQAVPINSETDDSGNGISFSGEVMSFDSGAVTSCELTEIYYIRNSTEAPGENLIITYNEEIS